MNRDTSSNEVEMTPERRRKILDELRGVLREAQDGDEEAGVAYSCDVVASRGIDTPLKEPE